MYHCGTETLLTANQFKMTDRLIKLKEAQLPLDVAQHCSVLVFPLHEFLWRKLHNVIKQNKALGYLLPSSRPQLRI